MRIQPTGPTNAAERHVQFSEFVDVRTYDIQETQSTTIQPTMDAQRLEAALRATEMAVVTTEAPQVNMSGCVRTYKRTCDNIGLACGLLTIPSVSLVAVGPWGLLAPVALVLAMIACFILRGKPTLEMEQSYTARAISAREHDCHGV